MKTQKYIYKNVFLYTRFNRLFLNTTNKYVIYFSTVYVKQNKHNNLRVDITLQNYFIKFFLNYLNYVHITHYLIILERFFFLINLIFFFYLIYLSKVLYIILIK